jgi:hypothetical protein
MSSRARSVHWRVGAADPVGELAGRVKSANRRAKFQVN